MSLTPNFFTISRPVTYRRELITHAGGGTVVCDPDGCIPRQARPALNRESPSVIPHYQDMATRLERIGKLCVDGDVVDNCHHARLMV